nr:helix-turn-helix transcriptional regulator [Kibdelosporangium sp. MJ126-NF4]CEL18095.1 Transcriptional regulator, PadR family [Kibdelosporangium sp. MJ126-NF4]CTQ90676.1 Transcriptional regulator, PadR family [Kibdelosporangium sp. MJ126-NF4]
MPPLTPAAFAVLLALTEGEQHGYRLVADVERLTGGTLVLGPGTLYRTLQRLRVDGMVEEIGTDEEAVRADRRAERRRSYRITPAGSRAVRGEARRLASLLTSDTAQAVLRSDERGE